MRDPKGSRTTHVLQLVALIRDHGGQYVTRRFSLALIFAVIASAVAPFGTVALKLIVDGYTSHEPGAASVGMAISLYVLSQLLFRLLNEARTFTFFKADRRIFTALSRRFFGHVLQLPFEFHSQRPAGGISQTRENGLQGLQIIVGAFLFMALPVLAQLIMTAWILASMRQWSFLLTFGTAIACYVPSFWFFNARASAAAKSASDAQIKASAIMNDCVSSYETVKYFTAEYVVEAKVQQDLVVTERRWIRFYCNFAALGLITAMLFAAVIATTILLSTQRVSAGTMTVGELVLVNTYVLQLIQPIEILAFATQQMSRGWAMLEQFLAMLHERTEKDTLRHSGAPEPQLLMAARSGAHQPNVVDHSKVVHPLFTGDALRPGGPTRTLAMPTTHHPSTSPRTAATLAFRGVGVSYGPDRQVLKDVDFVLQAGKTLGIVGASGSGKTTLVRLLMRLLDPTEGTILIDGVDVSDLSLHAVRSAIAVVPQDTALFNESIRYNIAFGHYGCSDLDIEQATRLAHLHQLVGSLPNGYDTPVGERGLKLSGGEKQRLSIARAVLKAPRIYVFDEATSSLDSTTEQQIMANLRDISRSQTTIIIAHRLSTVVHADEILVLERGTVTERGTHTELLERRGQYHALWVSQVSDRQTSKVG